MAILGLVSTELDGSPDNWRQKNIRREVFYFYPQGKAPLMGVMSLLDEEDTDDPEFSWWEERLKEQLTLTISMGATKGPFRNAADDVDCTDPFDWTADTEYTVYVASTTMFRVGHVVKIPVDTATTGELRGVVTSIVAATKLKVRALLTVAGVKNGTTNENVGKDCLVIGSAFKQGADVSTSETTILPVNPGNYVQIFRTPYSFTGTALKTGLKFDETGPYKHKSKQHSVYHMIEMEKAFIFGKKSKYVVSSLPTYTTDGILAFLESWEAGTMYENTAATLDSNDNKRIIANSAGYMNDKLYNTYLERIFRTTGSVANEKLVLCGSGFLSVINQMYKSQACLTADLPLKDTFGMAVVKHVTPFGTVYYKTHPLFSQNSTLRNSALFLEVYNMKYRYMQGRDTDLLKNRQGNGEDLRRDEWLTEAGLELRQPESFMFMQNVVDFIP